MMIRSIRKIWLVALLSGWCGHSAQAQAVVLCIGDSITEGAGFGLARTYPARLASNTGHDVINAGIGGQRAHQGLARIDGLLAAHCPSTVLILFGANDVWSPSADLRAAADAVLQMALRARAYGSTPVIATTPPFVDPRSSYMPRVDEFNGYVRARASANGVRLADLQATFGTGEGLFTEDGVHPNDAGMELIARTFAPRISAHSMLCVNPTSLSVAATGASRQAIAVGSGVGWTASANRSWISIISGASGSGNGTIVYNVAVNTGPARSGTITVSGGGISRTFTVNQAKAERWDWGYQNIGGGWRRLAWFGHYIPMGSDGWIWHSKHGFFYIPPNAVQPSIWIFTQDMGWLWTTRTGYPYLFRSLDGAWLWYNGGTNPRWFMNFKTGRWEYRP